MENTYFCGCVEMLHPSRSFHLPSFIQNCDHLSWHSYRFYVFQNSIYIDLCSAVIAA